MIGLPSFVGRLINRKNADTESINGIDGLKVESIEIPKGPMHVAVCGEHYSKSKPDSVTLRELTRFSLTPKCDYQVKMGWPEGDFFNVNVYPSMETTRDNWLGYVPYGEKPVAAKIAKSVYPGRAIYCWGYYDYDSAYDEIDIFLALPTQYVYRTNAKEIKRNIISDRENIMGNTFCVTTFLPFHSFQEERDLYQFIVDSGGKISDNLTLKTDYLIDCDPNYKSNKEARAAEYAKQGKTNVKIISPDEFLNLAGLSSRELFS